MAAKFSELSLPLIDEGEFLDNVNADLRELQARMVEYAQEHKELAIKAKGKLVIEISLQVVDPKDLAFSVKGVTKTVTPSRPASVSMALGQTGEDDRPSLFVRATGSDHVSPRQGILHTKKGQVVDTNTGGVTEES